MSGPDKQENIPIIDINALQDTNTGKDEVTKKLARSLVDAMSTVGFVYIVGHGIDQQEIDLVNKTSKSFFELPLEVKEGYKRGDTDNNGWVSVGRESLNPERPGDLKEAYNVNIVHVKDTLRPDKEVSGFSDVINTFYKSCNDLALTLLRLIGIGLQLEDPEYFVNNQNPFTRDNATALRLLYYPPLPETTDIKQNQIRCGEHSDYGSITLLFQDSVGGLEVCGSDGQYIPATPIPGSVVVNIGDLMQRWTADKLKSTRHRVLLPPDEPRARITRQSMAYFVHPDDDCLVECIDGSNKYEKITALDYLKMRFAATYNY